MKHPLKLNLFSSILKSRTDSFNKIERHYLAKLPDTEDAFDNAKVVNTLNSLCVEMDNRYSFERCDGAKY
jgi:S-DNA-T family DNA segregation ATPase FtsK/SpoIIIE